MVEIVTRAGAAAQPRTPSSRELIEAGALVPVVDRTYALVDAAEGVRHVERGHARGKVVVTVPG